MARSVAMFAVLESTGHTCNCIEYTTRSAAPKLRDEHLMSLACGVNVSVIYVPSAAAHAIPLLGPTAIRRKYKNISFRAPRVEISIIAKEGVRTA